MSYNILFPCIIVLCVCASDRKIANINVLIYRAITGQNSLSNHVIKINTKHKSA